MNADAFAKAFVQAAAQLGERQLRAQLAALVNYNRWLGATDAEIKQLLQQLNWRTLNLSPEQGIRIALESAKDRSLAAPFIARILEDTLQEERRKNPNITFGQIWQKTLPTLRQWGFKEFELVQLRDAIFNPNIPLEFYKEGFRFGAPPSSDPLLRTPLGRHLAQRLTQEGDDLASVRPYYETARKQGIAQAEQQRQRARYRAAAQAEREHYLQQLREGNLWEKWTALVHGGLRGAQRTIASLLTGIPIEELPPAATLPGMLSPTAREIETMPGFSAGVARGALGFLDPYGWATLGASLGLGAAAAPAITRLPTTAQRTLAASVPILGSTPAAYQSLQQGDTGGALGALAFGALLAAPIAARGANIRFPTRQRPTRQPVAALPPVPRALPAPETPPPAAPPRGATPPPETPPPTTPPRGATPTPETPPPTTPITETPPTATRIPPPPTTTRQTRVSVQESELYTTPQGTRFGIVLDESTGNYRIVDATNNEISTQAFPANQIGQAARQFQQGTLPMQPAQVQITPRLVIPPPPPLEPEPQRPQPTLAERTRQLQADLQLLQRYQQQTGNNAYTHAALNRMQPQIAQLQTEIEQTLQQIAEQAQQQGYNIDDPQMLALPDDLAERYSDAANAQIALDQIQRAFQSLYNQTAPRTTRQRRTQRQTQEPTTQPETPPAPQQPTPRILLQPRPHTPATTLEAVLSQLESELNAYRLASDKDKIRIRNIIQAKTDLIQREWQRLAPEEQTRARELLNTQHQAYLDAILQNDFENRFLSEQPPTTTPSPFTERGQGGEVQQPTAPDPNIALTLRDIQQLAEAYHDATNPAFKRQLRADIERKINFILTRLEQLSFQQQERLRDQLPPLHRNYLDHIQSGTFLTEVLGDETTETDDRRPTPATGETTQPVAPAGRNTDQLGEQPTSPPLPTHPAEPTPPSPAELRRPDTQRSRPTPESRTDAGRRMGNRTPRTAQPPEVDTERPATPTDTGTRAEPPSPTPRLDTGLEPTARNYQLTPDDRAYFTKATERQKIEASLEAIRTLKDLQTTGRQPTPEDQAKLARFAGWGAIWRILDPNQNAYADEREQLRQLLTPDEYNAARLAALNAHYTIPDLIEQMWRIAQRLGVQPNARILEPAAGMGLMAALSPIPAHWTFIEKDKITAAILHYLYPEYRTHNMGFEQLEGGKNQYDLVISNVPFGNFGVHDPAYPAYITRRIHDYFLVKAADMLRTGGVMLVITSRYSLDKQNPAIREALAQRGMQLLAAYRLPNTTFKDFAATSVVVDLLVFQKQPEPVQNPNYIETRTKTFGAHWLYQRRRGYTQQTETAPVNEYYHANPDHILGEETVARGMYAANEYTVQGDFDPQKLQALIDQLPQNIYQPAAHTDEIQHRNAGLQSQLAGRHYFKNNQLYTVELIEETDPTTGQTTIVPTEKPVPLTPEQRAAWQDYITLRDSLLAVLEADAKGENADPLRRQLKQAYDHYIQKHGALNPPRKRQPWDEDLDAPVVRNLEERDPKGKLIQLSPVFEKPIVYQPTVQPTTPYEALIASLATFAKIDWEWMSQTLNIPIPQLQQQLENEVILNADGEWELLTEFLAGNLGEKLTRYENLHAIDPRYDKHLQLLRNAIPDPIPLEMLRISLGATWIPEQLKADYFEDMLGYRFTIYRDERGLYELDEKPLHTGRGQLGYFPNASTAKQLVRAALNDRIDITAKDPSGKPDPAETEHRRDIVRQLRENFKNWLLQRPPSTITQLEQRYLRTIGAQRSVDYTPLAQQVDWTTYGINPAIQLRPHQKRAILRILRQPATLLHHEVGAGKTFTLVASAILAKRIGLVRKPVIVVQKATLPQFVAQARTLFPNARIYYASREADFQPQNRRKFLAAAAFGNWDVIILTHEQFEEIPIASETQIAWIEEQLELERQALTQQEGRTLKDIEQAVERMRKRLLGYTEKLKKKRKFGLDFETIGFDMLLVDESHQWKGMPFYTILQDAQYQPSDRGIDGFLKCEIVRAKGGKIVFASGTPIVNKLAEMYILIRALNPAIWHSLGIRTFEEWRLTFAEQTGKIETTIRGERKRVFRLDTYLNAQKLAELYRQVADVFFIEDDPNLKATLPTLENERGEPTGRYIVYTIPKNPIYNEISNFFQRMQAAPEDPKQKGAAILKSFSYAKRAIVDPRLIELDLQDPFLLENGLTTAAAALNRQLARAAQEPTLKLRVAAQNIARIYNETTPTKATQLVFIDRGVPNQDAFNAYDELRRFLTEYGVPKEHIAYIHDAANDQQRNALFEKVNNGDIRILIGSTEKMGIGVNVQQRLIASHYIDVPWRPADLEQRDGRIRRQGNTHKRVRIYVYINEGNPIEEPFWHIVNRKLQFIRDFFRGKFTGDVLEDLNSEIDYKEVLAALTSSKYAQELEQTLSELENKRRAYYAQAGKIAAHRKLLSETETQLKQLIQLADEQHRLNLFDDALRQQLKQIIPALRQELHTYPLEKLPQRNQGDSPPTLLLRDERGTFAAYALLTRYEPAGEIQLGSEKATLYTGETDELLWAAIEHPKIVIVAAARNKQLATIRSRLIKTLENAEQLLLDYEQLHQRYNDLRNNPPQTDPQLEQEVRQLEAKLREIEDAIRKEAETGVIEEDSDDTIIPSLFGGLQILYEKLLHALQAKRQPNITVRKPKHPHTLHLLRSPVGIYDIEGNPIGAPGYYETIGGERGKQIAEAFALAQEQLDRETHHDLQRIELILNALERAYQQHKQAGSRLTREQLLDRFIDLIEKPYNDPQRQNIAQHGGALGEALRAHDELTEEWRQRIIHWRRQLGIPTPDDWGITQQGYFRHLFAGDIEIRKIVQTTDERGNPITTDQFLATAPNYVEALAIAHQHLQNNPNDQLIIQIRNNLPLDPTVRVSTRQYFRIVGELADRTQLSHAEIMEDLRGVIGQARKKRKILGFEKRRQGYTGWLRDYTRVMTLTAAQIARARALTSLKRAAQPHIEHWRKIGLHGIAEHVETHIDALWGATSKTERDLSQLLQQIPILGNFLSPTPYLFRTLAHRITRLQTWLKLEAQIKGIPLIIRPAIVNLLDPLRTLFPYVSVRELAWAYVQLLDPQTRRELHKLGVVDLRAGLKLNEGALLIELERASPSWFKRASMVNRAVGYLIGRKRALDKGFPQDQAHINGLRWARRAEYDNSLWYCAPILRSPLARIILQFKGYQLKAIEDWFWSIRRLPATALGGAGGSGGGAGGANTAPPTPDAPEPTPRWLARAAKLIAAQLLVSGIKGFLGAFTTLLGGYLIYTKLKEALKQTGVNEQDADYYARALYFGAPALLSVDLSASTTLWELPYGYTAEQRLANLLLGPTGSTALALANPELTLTEKLKRATPAARWIEVAPQLWDGKTNIRIGRDRRTGVITRQEAILYALGFQPVNRSLAFEQREHQRR